jgi:stage II sporulation protein D
MIRFATLLLWPGLFLMVGLSGCGAPETDLPPLKGPVVGQIGPEPTLRVRVAKGQEQLRLNADAFRVARAGEDGTVGDAYRLAGPVTVRRREGAFELIPGDGNGLRWATTQLRIEATGGRAVGMGDGRYSGTFQLVAVPGKAGPSPARFDVVNHLGIETYLPGVLAKELYRDWNQAAYKAQAVAARSYALFERNIHRGRHYDLNSTTASQVYGGEADHPRAVSAAAATRGQVLTYNGRVLPAYYSSACGGAGQDAAAAFERGLDVPPLQGRAGQDWCRGSSKYRWGPFARSAERLRQRMQAWGEGEGHAVRRLGRLRSIEVAERSGSGRPAFFQVVDQGGQRFRLRCGAFREACNFAGGSLPSVEEGKRLFSSFVEASVAGDRVHFRDGRGFGHGVGLCQWGAQGLAEAGHEYRRVLGQYYREAELRRVY